MSEGAEKITPRTPDRDKVRGNPAPVKEVYSWDAAQKGANWHGKARPPLNRQAAVSAPPKDSAPPAGIAEQNAVAPEGKTAAPAQAEQVPALKVPQVPSQEAAVISPAIITALQEPYQNWATASDREKLMAGTLLRDAIVGQLKKIYPKEGMAGRPAADGTAQLYMSWLTSQDPDLQGIAASAYMALAVQPLEDKLEKAYNDGGAETAATAMETLAVESTPSVAKLFIETSGVLPKIASDLKAGKVKDIETTLHSLSASVENAGRAQLGEQAIVSAGAILADTLPPRSTLKFVQYQSAITATVREGNASLPLAMAAHLKEQGRLEEAEAILDAVKRGAMRARSAAESAQTLFESRNENALMVLADFGYATTAEDRIKIVSNYNKLHPGALKSYNETFALVDREALKLTRVLTALDMALPSLAEGGQLESAKDLALWYDETLAREKTGRAIDMAPSVSMDAVYSQGAGRMSLEGTMPPMWMARYNPVYTKWVRPFMLALIEGQRSASFRVSQDNTIKTGFLSLFNASIQPLASKPNISQDHWFPETGTNWFRRMIPPLNPRIAYEAAKARGEKFSQFKVVEPGEPYTFKGSGGEHVAFLSRIDVKRGLDAFAFSSAGVALGYGYVAASLAGNGPPQDDRLLSQMTYYGGFTYASLGLAKNGPIDLFAYGIQRFGVNAPKRFDTWKNATGTIAGGSPRFGLTDIKSMYREAPFAILYSASFKFAGAGLDALDSINKMGKGDFTGAGLSAGQVPLGVMFALFPNSPFLTGGARPVISPQGPEFLTDKSGKFILNKKGEKILKNYPRMERLNFGLQVAGEHLDADGKPNNAFRRYTHRLHGEDGEFAEKIQGKKYDQLREALIKQRGPEIGAQLAKRYEGLKLEEFAAAFHEDAKAGRVAFSGQILRSLPYRFTVGLSSLKAAAGRGAASVSFAALDNFLGMFGGLGATAPMAILAFAAWHHYDNVEREKLVKEARTAIGSNIIINKNSAVQKSILNTLIQFNSDRRSPGQALSAALYGRVSPEEFKRLLYNLEPGDLRNLEMTAKEAMDLVPGAGGEFNSRELDLLYRNINRRFPHLLSRRAGSR